MKKFIIGAFALWCSACANYSSESAFQALNTVNNNEKLSNDVPECLVKAPEYLLDTHIAAFEITDKFNVGFGFDLIKGFFKALGLSIKVEKGRMTLFMHLFESTHPNSSIASSPGEGILKGKEFRFTLGANQLGIDLGYYNRTPLAKLSEKALSSGLANVRSEMSSLATAWRTRVADASVKDNYIIVPVGSVAGLRIGDELSFYNVDRIWLGAPCASDVIERKTTKNPLVIAKATHVDYFATLFEYIVVDDGEVLRPGGRAEIHSLIGNSKKNPRSLRVPVQIRNVVSENLALPDGTTIDITPYAADQMAALFDKYGFYPTNLGHN